MMTNRRAEASRRRFAPGIPFDTGRKSRIAPPAPPARGTTPRLNVMSESASELSRLYSARFSDTAAYRNRVWTILTGQFFSRWIQPTDTVLDLGCGYGNSSIRSPRGSAWRWT